MSVLDFLNRAVETADAKRQKLEEQTDLYYKRFAHMTDRQLMDRISHGSMAEKLAAKKLLNERGYGN